MVVKMIDPELIAAFGEISTSQEGYTNKHQRTAEWYMDRAGKITGSRFSDILKGKKGAYLAARERVINQMVLEHITGKPMMSDSFKQTEWGNECEGMAVVAYEKKKNCKIVETGFIDHPDVDLVGCSADGFIFNTKGIIEIKCPYDQLTHMANIHGIPDKYYPQAQGNMWVTQSNFCEFISFDPRLPEKYQLITHTIKRDEDFIENLHQECLKTIDHFKDRLEAVKEQFE